MLRKLKNLLDKTLETGLWVSMLAMTLTVIWQVFTRFVLRDPSSWTEEMSIFLLIWIGLLGSAVALRRKAHLGIDILVLRFPERWARLAAIFVFLCVIFFSLGVLFIGGIRLVTVILMNNQISPAMGIKMGYIYLALPISGFFITMYAVEFILEEIRALSGRKPADKPETGRMNVAIE
jgi:TRAP-type C4-dicarboxylate transport system permease small subunit